MTTPPEVHRRRVLVVGAGPRFLSGMSYYTWKVAGALADKSNVIVILMRNLIPGRLYPGSKRIGQKISSIEYSPTVTVLDGVDWWWGRSIFRALRLLRHERPDVALFQWWTGAVGHSYLVLAWMARLAGAQMVIEFHESQDVGEATLPLAQRYAGFFLQRLLKRSSGVIYHSEFDRTMIESMYDVGVLPWRVIPHGPYDQYALGGELNERREASAEDYNILFFGVIRPFKGLEHLVEAFDLVGSQFPSTWLTVVGETWEGWTLPSELIEAHPRGDRITFVNRYVSDEELGGWLKGADLVVLPYLRSSASGPLHTAMSTGLPVVTTAVGGLPEAAGKYEGVSFVAPSDPNALASAIAARVTAGRGKRFADPHSWGASEAAYTSFFDYLEKDMHGVSPASSTGALRSGSTELA